MLFNTERLPNVCYFPFLTIPIIIHVGKVTLLKLLEF